MEHKTWDTVDKSGWGPGPWQDEPDKEQFADKATGYACLVKRNRFGALCGYVGVPQGHPWHGKGYDDVEADVHGGLTYAAPCQEGPEGETICHVPGPGEPEPLWWLGFDCNHAWDVAPGMDADIVAGGGARQCAATGRRTRPSPASGPSAPVSPNRLRELRRCPERGVRQSPQRPQTAVEFCLRLTPPPGCRRVLLMTISKTEPSGDALSPQRGDTVEITVGGKGPTTGKVTSTYLAGGTSPRVTVVAGGKKYTRLAGRVHVIKRGGTVKIVRDPAARRLAPAMRKPGEPAPNRGMRFPAGILTPEEADALIAAKSPRRFCGKRNRALLTLLRRSGLRVGEALALRASDIDLDRHSIRLAATKSGKAQTRGFHPAAAMPLMRWMEARAARGLGRKGVPLFCTHAGGPLSAGYVRQMMKDLAAKAGIEKRVHPHGLRHTFAVDCERSGMTVTQISELLGHSSVAVTARYLAHLSNGEAISALEAAELPGTSPAPASIEDQVAALTGQVAVLTSRLGLGRKRGNAA
jgi:integrase